MRATHVALILAFSSQAVFAIPPARQAEVTDPGLNPWVTVDASGHGSTITPVLTTINGVATTLNAAPAALTATMTTSITTDDNTGTSTGPTPTATGGSGGAFEVCNNLDGGNMPFCQPTPGETLYIGETTYVTWDTGLFKPNASVLIQVNYVNASIGGVQAFQSPQTPNSWGFISFTPDNAWLQGFSRNNLTLFITAQGASHTGPTITIMKRPPVYNQMPPTQPPKGQSLYIALPTVVGFICVCVCGSYIWNRKNRRIGLGNIMGHSGRGYAIGKSRRQRMKVGNKAGAIQLREQELATDGRYRDVPVKQPAGAQHGRNESDLEDLVESPTEGRPQRGNVFRDELRRQEAERN